MTWHNRSPWTAAEDAIIIELYPTHSGQQVADVLNRSLRAVYQRVHALGLRKTREWIAERARELSNQPDHGGIASRFQPGLEPWNKGKHFNAGGRSVGTQFKKGERRARALALWLPVGSLRINAEGYVDRKINDGLPMHKRWRAVHLLAWEAAHGAIPQGHIVIFKDGNKLNANLDNLECISRRENMLRNTVHRNGPEIAAISQLRGALARQINRRNRGQQPQGEPA